MMQQKAEMIPFIESEIKRWGDVIERAKLEAVGMIRKSGHRFSEKIMAKIDSSLAAG